MTFFFFFFFFSHSLRECFSCLFHLACCLILLCHYASSFSLKGAAYLCDISAGMNPTKAPDTLLLTREEAPINVLLIFFFFFNKLDVVEQFWVHSKTEGKALLACHQHPPPGGAFVIVDDLYCHVVTRVHSLP